MSVLFSKVELWTDDGNECEFLACGIPQDETDLEVYTAYQEFMEAHSEINKLEADIKSYVYGDGETDDANIYRHYHFSTPSPRHCNFCFVRFAVR